MFFEGTYPHKHAIAATPEGLRGLAPRGAGRRKVVKPVESAGSRPGGLPGVAKGRYEMWANADTACASASIDTYISVLVPSSFRTTTMIPQSFRSRALWGALSTGACGVGEHPTPDLSWSESVSRSAPEKSK